MDDFPVRRIRLRNGDKSQPYPYDNEEAKDLKDLLSGLDGIRSIKDGKWSVAFGPGVAGHSKILVTMNYDESSGLVASIRYDQSLEKELKQALDNLEKTLKDKGVNQENLPLDVIISQAGTQRFLNGADHPPAAHAARVKSAEPTTTFGKA